jgi:hypothetical protein
LCDIKPSESSIFIIIMYHLELTPKSYELTIFKNYYRRKYIYWVDFSVILWYHERSSDSNYHLVPTPESFEIIFKSGHISFAQTKFYFQYWILFSTQPRTFILFIHGKRKSVLNHSPVLMVNKEKEIPTLFLFFYFNFHFPMDNGSRNPR